MRSPSSSTAWSGSPIISTAISPARRDSISRLGQFLDPIADKIMVAAVLVMLISSRKAEPARRRSPVCTSFPALVILLREIIVSGLREFLAGLQVSVPVSALAKWKTTLQLVALGRAHPRRSTARAAVGASGRNHLPVGRRGAHARDRLRLSPHRSEAHGLSTLRAAMIEFPTFTDELYSFPSSERRA